MHQCIASILFWNGTLHVSDGLSVHHQEFETVHTATGICQTDTAVCLLAGTRWLVPACTAKNSERKEGPVERNSGFDGSSR